VKVDAFMRNLYVSRARLLESRSQADTASS